MHGGQGLESVVAVAARELEVMVVLKNSKMWINMSYMKGLKNKTTAQQNLLGLVVFALGFGNADDFFLGTCPSGLLSNKTGGGVLNRNALGGESGFCRCRKAVGRQRRK